MTSMRSRRTIVTGIASLGIASIGITAGPGLRAKTLFQTNGIESGGIGLSRTEWESTYGPGEATQSHGLYRDPAYGGPIYVGFDFVNFEDGLLDILEIQWSDVSQGGGLSQEEAAAQISILLPADAPLGESYFMGATPGGPTALRSQRWTSQALDVATNGRTSILVIYQERTGQLPGSTVMDFTVTAATIAVEQG